MSKDSIYFSQAEELKGKLLLCGELDEKRLPLNSLLREFIG